MIPEAWRRGEVAVLGLGRSGVAAAEFLVASGVRVYASDAGNAERLQGVAERLQAAGVVVELGRHDVDRVRRSTAVVVSPGVPPEIEALVAARTADVEILAEIDLAARNLTESKFVVVTGTNGKTTTTALVAYLLQAAGIRAVAAGNIGRPLIDIVRQPSPPSWCVVEASSFQLHDAPHLIADVGVLTNLAPDHHNRYSSVDAYYADKKRLFQSATESSRWVLNGDDPAALALAIDAPGHRSLFSLKARADGWYDRAGDRLMLGDAVLLPRPSLPLLGDHNVANALAAALAAAAVGLPPEVIARALPSFPAPPHRLEPIAEEGGIRWINDSKATNVASATAALRAMAGSFVWLAGGEDKGEDFGPLHEELARCRAVLAFGEAAPRLAAALRDDVLVRVVPTLADAVAEARRLAEHGDVVLLSPACASFDQFTDFEQRGEAFRHLVTTS